MQERMADEIEDGIARNADGDWIADRVLAEMREPTPEMLKAAWVVFRDGRPGQLLGPGPGFKEVWQAMIDAAKAEVVDN